MTDRTEYLKEYYIRKREGINAHNREQYKLKKPLFSARAKRNATKVKQTFLDMYGNKCSCCGETEFDFLTVEHIKGQVGIPKNQKRSGHNGWKDATKEYRPDLYTILCFNCNLASKNGRTCPHKR